MLLKTDEKSFVVREVSEWRKWIYCLFFRERESERALVLRGKQALGVQAFLVLWGCSRDVRPTAVSSDGGLVPRRPWETGVKSSFFGTQLPTWVTQADVPFPSLVC